MNIKLAGHLPLQDMIAQIVQGTRNSMHKTASSEDEKVKKLVAYEKREHGKIPTPKEEEAEKRASAGVIDHSDPEEVEKLASALESVADALEKDAGDSVENGGESKQGGEQLPTMNRVGGKQPYKKDGSKKHSVPMSTGMQTGDAGGASTQVPNDHAKTPGGAPYPAKGVMKTAAEGVMAKIQAATKPMDKEAAIPPAFAANAKKVVAAQDKDKPGAEKPDLGAKGKKDDKEEKEEKKDDKDEEKKASASVDYILSKLSGVENGGESKQGGEQLSNTAPVPSNPGRELISSNAAVVAATKAKAKAPQKKLLSQVLTEPALSKSTDSKVHENLRNATKGGVKIAAARVLLQKIAAEGCQCSGKGDCKYCKMKAAKSKMEKDSNAMMGYGAGAPPSSPKPMI